MKKGDHLNSKVNGLENILLKQFLITIQNKERFMIFIVLLKISSLELLFLCWCFTESLHYYMNQF